MTKFIGPLVLLFCALATAANGQTRTFTYIGAPADGADPATRDAKLFPALARTVSPGVSGGTLPGGAGPKKRSESEGEAALGYIINMRPINIKAISFTPKNPGGFSFVGQPSYEIPGQNTRITGVINFVVQSLGGPQTISIGICYQRDSVNPVTSFIDNPPINRLVDATNRVYVASATGVIPYGGPVKFGACIGKNNADVYVSTLDGWLMSTTK